MSPRHPTPTVFTLEVEKAIRDQMVWKRSSALTTPQKTCRHRLKMPLYLLPALYISGLELFSSRVRDCTDEPEKILAFRVRNPSSVWDLACTHVDDEPATNHLLHRPLPLGGSIRALVSLLSLQAVG